MHNISFQFAASNSDGEEEEEKNDSSLIIDYFLFKNY